jgi:alanyl-tRNA synthetase
MTSSNVIKINNQIVFENGKLNGGLLSFMLYDTYGFPFDLTQQILREHNIEIDEADFEKYLQEQKDRSKGDRAKNDASSAKNNEVWSSVAERLKSKYGADFATEKLYYQGATDCDAKILAIVKDGEMVDVLQVGEQGFLVLDKTCFYPCGGGEVGDKGVIGSSVVFDTQKFKGDIIGHSVKAREELRVGDEVKCLSFRKRVGNNHTATHLLQSALRLVLGDGVQQKGSQVDENGLRFDFSNTRAMATDEIKKVEEIVNGWIADYLPVSAVEMSKSEAEKLNALHFFEDKYGEKVRVVRVFDRSGTAISTEFCGGIHCRNTGEIEAFAIESEKGIGSGGRIEHSRLYCHQSGTRGL